MSYDDDERSVSQNRPIDLYTITTLTATYRVTSHPIDVTYGGQTYTATTMSRGNQQVTQDPTGRELVVYLPISHPLVQRFAASGIPEQSVVITALRMQEVSGVAVQFFTGPAQSMSIDGHTALVRAPQLTDDAFRIQLPVVAGQRSCNHRLGDIGCAPNPGGQWPATAGVGTGGPDIVSLSVHTTLSSVSPDGLTVTIASTGGNLDNWAQYGRLIMSTGEARRVISHVGAAIVIDVPFVSTTPLVTLEPGCAHDIGTCIAKFNNQVNFGGHPQMNAEVNPWIPNGLGVVTQV